LVVRVVTEVRSTAPGTNERTEKYIEDRLTPAAAQGRVVLYPKSEAPLASANWYELPFEERRRLWAVTAVGRTYAGGAAADPGSVVSTTGCGGVTLPRRRPVSSRRSSTRCARRGSPLRELAPSLTGLLLDPADALARGASPPDRPAC